MSELSSTIKPLDLKGFSLSTNHAVPILQEVHGLEFPFVPPVVETGFRNRFAMMSKGNIVRALFPFGLGLNHKAHYNLQYRAIFVPPGKGTLDIQAHESTHAYIHGKFPDLACRTFVLNSAVSKAISGQDPGEVDVEKHITFAALEEGMAEWVSIFAGLTYKEGFDPEELKKRQHEYITPLRIYDTEPHEGHISISFDDLEYIIRSYQESLRLHGSGASRERRKTRHFFHALYIAGHYYVYELMRRKPQGMQNAEAIDKILATPPSNLQELRYPIYSLESIFS